MSSAPGPGDHPEPPLEPEPQLQAAVGAGIDGHGQATSKDILEARGNQSHKQRKRIRRQETYVNSSQETSKP